MENKFRDRRQIKRHKEFLKEKAELVDWKKRLEKIYAEEEDANESGTKKQKHSSEKVSRYHKEIKKFQKIQTSKAIEREEFLKKKQEKEEALAKYHSEQKKKKKMLYKKTTKGQPNMDSRMKLLLEKIEKQRE